MQRIVLAVVKWAQQRGVEGRVARVGDQSRRVYAGALVQQQLNHLHVAVLHGYVQACGAALRSPGRSRGAGWVKGTSKAELRPVHGYLLRDT